MWLSCFLKTGYFLWHVSVCCFLQIYDFVPTDHTKAKLYFISFFFFFFFLFCVIQWAVAISCFKSNTVLFKKCTIKSSVEKNVHNSMKNTTIECHSPVFSTHTHTFRMRTGLSCGVERGRPFLNSQGGPHVEAQCSACCYPEEWSCQVVLCAGRERTPDKTLQKRVRTESKITKK